MPRIPSISWNGVKLDISKKRGFYFSSSMIVGSCMSSGAGTKQLCDLLGPILVPRLYKAEMGEEREREREKEKKREREKERERKREREKKRERGRGIFERQKETR